MHVLPTPLADVKLLQPKRYTDARGWFMEVFNGPVFLKAGLPSIFVQDNQSFSNHGVLRGLHYQVVQQQAKLVRVVSGHIWDVVVDLRTSSPQFGQWASFELTSGDGTMLWIPEGYAHGFLTLSATAEVLYKVTDFYSPQGERCIRWNDPALAISWPLEQLGMEPILSDKDAQGCTLAEAELPDTFASSAGSSDWQVHARA